jgi:hypothetical protein
MLYVDCKDAVTFGMDGGDQLTVLLLKEETGGQTSSSSE